METPEGVGGNMRIGSVVQYRYFVDGGGGNHGWGVVTNINRVDPDRPFFFVSWIKDHNQYGKKLRNTWYHPSRLEVVCE